METKSESSDSCLTIRPEGFRLVSELPLLATYVLSILLDFAIIGPTMYELGRWRRMQALEEGFRAGPEAVRLAYCSYTSAASGCTCITKHIFLVANTAVRP